MIFKTPFRSKHRISGLALFTLLAYGAMAVYLLPHIANAQEEELELIETVDKLVLQLDAESNADRDQAETKLLEMGPSILDYLDVPTADATTDFRDRVARIRKTLEKKAVTEITQPGKVTLSGSMTVGDALKQIKRQTRNEILVADDSLLDIQISVELEGVDFWNALDEILAKSKLGIDRYGNRKPGQLMLAPVTPNANQPVVPTAFSKIFQTQVLRVDSSVNLMQPQLDYSTVSLLVRWEPRLRPISVDVPMSQVSVVDEFGDNLMLVNPKEVVYGMVQPEIPEVEFSLQLPRVDRQVESLKRITATVDAVLPGRVETFRFKNLSKLNAGFNIEKAGARVAFGGSKKNEDVFSVRVSLSFDEANNALESHQGWVFQNEAYLENSQGVREESISIETLRQDNEKVTVQYYFIEDPADRTFVYKTPASIVKMPVKFTIEKIPLP